MMLEKLLIASNVVLAIFALICSCRVILRQEVRPRWALALAFTGALAFILRVATQAVNCNGDFYLFWRTGQYVLNGTNPYTITPPPGSLLPLHTPNALPLFAAVGLFPFNLARVIFCIMNTFLALVAVPMAWATLVSQEGRLPPGLSWPVVTVLNTAFFLSSAVYFCIFLGQLGLVITTLLLAAFYAQGRGRPLLAGIWMALTAIKVVTGVPTLLLFLRRSDWPTWASFGVVSASLCVLATPPELLPSRLRDNMKLVRSYDKIGAINDYSCKGPENHSIIGFEHLFYWLGLRDRVAIRWLQYTAVGLLGVGIVLLLHSSWLSRGGACSLVLLYSSIFLYHRTYDAAMLALPMLHTAGRARSESGRARKFFAGSAIAILLILSTYGSIVKAIGRASHVWPAAVRIPVQAFVLPYATWLILASISLLILGERSSGRAPA